MKFNFSKFILYFTVLFCFALSSTSCRKDSNKVFEPSKTHKKGPGLETPNGHIVLNGGDVLFLEVEHIREELLEILSRKNICTLLSEEEIAVFRNKVKLFKIIPVGDSEPVPDQYKVNSSELTLDTKIIINGQRRTGANAPSENVIFLDRDLFAHEFNKRDILYHEIFGLAGLEKTDEYDKTKNLTQSIRYGCFKKEDGITGQIIQEGCPYNIESLSSYSEFQVFSHPEQNQLIVYDSHTRCLLFWDVESMKRLSELDININSDVSVKEIFISSGRLILQVSPGFLLYFDLENYERVATQTLNLNEYVQDKVFFVGDYIISSNAFEIFLRKNDDQYADFFWKAELHSSSPIFQVLGGKPNVYTVVHLDGTVSELHIKNTSESASATPEVMLEVGYIKNFRLSQGQHELPFYSLQFDYLVNADMVRMKKDQGLVHDDGTSLAKLYDESLIGQGIIAAADTVEQSILIVNPKPNLAQNADYNELIGLRLDYKDPVWGQETDELQTHKTIFAEVSKDYTQVYVNESLDSYVLTGAIKDRGYSYLKILRFNRATDSLIECSFTHDYCSPER